MSTILQDHTTVILPEGFTARGASMPDVEAAIVLYNRWSQSAIGEDEITLALRLKVHFWCKLPDGTRYDAPKCQRDNVQGGVSNAPKVVQEIIDYLGGKHNKTTEEQWTDAGITKPNFKDQPKVDLVDWKPKVRHLPFD